LTISLAEGWAEFGATCRYSSPIVDLGGLTVLWCHVAMHVCSDGECPRNPQTSEQRELAASTNIQSDAIAFQLYKQAKLELVALKAAEALKSSHNTGSPKLPHIEDVIIGASKAVQRPLSQSDIDIVTEAYEFIERQLQAGA